MDDYEDKSKSIKCLGLGEMNIKATTKTKI